MQDIREKLIDLLTGYSLDTYEDVQYVADELIAKGVVPVVRCKNCSYMEDAYVCNGFLICPASNMEITDNDFCSYGEKKEADGNG